MRGLKIRNPGKFVKLIPVWPTPSSVSPASARLVT